jgi:peptidoglycan hydrolase-like protein with peptidoglycan-binding domain
MKTKSIATAVLLASVALTPLSPMTAPARADGKDVVAGLIIGGIIGSAITNENNKKKSAKSTKAGTKSTKSSISAEQRAANKEVQVALNYFGYNVGTADGSIGPKTRGQIKEYQAFIGYPATGELSEHERTILVTGYHRAVAGGPVIAEAVAGSVYGLKAVLIAQRDEMAGAAPGGLLAGAPPAPVAGSVEAAAIAALPLIVPEAPVVEDVAVAPEPAVTPVPEVAVAEVKDPALPSFMGAAGAKGSLAGACAEIGQTTAANGGMVTADGMQDAGFALGEQFCLVRGFAVADGDKLMGQIASFTPDEIAQQCAGFGPVLKEHVAALSLKPGAEVLQGVQDFVLASGMSPAQLAGTAKVCLGVGYAKDDMEVAIGSALMLTALGQTGYAEFLGHHLSQGFGAAERPDLAMDWYQLSLDAMEKGLLVVAPGVEGRDAVIRKAAFTINGRADELEPEAEIQEAALPVFEVTPEALTETAVAEPPAAVEPALTEVAVAEPAPAPEPVLEVLPEVVAEAPLPAPVMVAPKPMQLGTTTPAPLPKAVAEAPALPDPSPMPAAGDAGIVQAGTQAAIMAARLPFLIFSSY